MGHMTYDYTKSSIVKVCNNKDLFVKELIKASKVLQPYQKENLINWLFFYTADKPEMQKWLYEVLDKNVLVS
jgi:putative methionine-R-sulfoxide reductase with GAF domain